MWHEHGPVAVRGTARFTFSSERAGVDLEISVAGRPRRDGEPPRPALYVLDGNLTFLVAAPIVRSYELLARGHFPATTVVGIGYADAAASMSRRMLDLTPTTSPGEGPVAAGAAAGAHGFGGAGAFVAALREEVIPEVERRFGCDPGDRTLAGWSLGGLFGLHVLLSEPELFRRYLLVSPSIWWDGAHVLRQEEAWAAAHDDLPADVFIAAGDREETAPSRSWPPMPPEMAVAAGMVSQLHTLTRRIRRRGYRSLRWEARVVADEHHASIFPAALGLGLRHLHTDVR